MQIVDFLDRAEALWPDRPCFVTDSVRITYAEAARLTTLVASGLQAEGFRPGQHAAVLSGNHPVAMLCAMGASRAGLVWLPINPRSTPSEIADLLEFLDCDVLFYSGAYEQVLLSSAVSRLPRLRYICIDMPSSLGATLSDWLPDAADEVPNQPSAQDTAILVATGGTTGKPKGVMLTHRNVEAYVASHLACMPAPDKRVYLAAAPMTHAAGIIWFAIMASGGTTIILPTFQPRAVLQAIQEHHVTDLFLPPTAVYMLLEESALATTDVSSLRYLMYGGAPMSTEKLQYALRIFGPVMAQIFGQAEVPMLCTFLSPAEHFDGINIAPLTRLSSAGRATPFVRLAIMDADGRLLPAPEHGEIVVRSELVMKGYFKNPEATREASLHGWHHTGDIGFVDAHGYLYIVDRKKDMIISGGMNIYPAEIEQVLWAHSAVRDCAVIGVPDAKWGEAVKAIVELASGSQACAGDLLSYCKERLGSIKAPKSVEIWSELPRSSVGKVLKREIRSRFWVNSERTGARTSADALRAEIPTGSE
jgi:fatty-acyl-CoA synthase